MPLTFKQYFEESSYRNITDFFTNYNFSSSSWRDMVHDFSRDGGLLLGEGVYGYTVKHPDWNYVVKIYEEDACYTNFIRFVSRNQQLRHFPKIIGREQKFHLKNSKKYLYLVRMEELLPLTELPPIKDLLSSKILYFIDCLKHERRSIDHIMKTFIRVTPKNLQEKISEFSGYSGDWERLNEFFYQKHFYHVLENLFHYYKSVPQGCFFDLHEENIMVRPKTHELVISDPVASTASHPLRKLKKHRKLKKQNY